MIQNIEEKAEEELKQRQEKIQAERKGNGRRDQKNLHFSQKNFEQHLCSIYG